MVPGAPSESRWTCQSSPDGQAGRWTEGRARPRPASATTGAGAVLSTRPHERAQQLVDGLQRLDDYQRQLIATVSHELTNPGESSSATSRRLSQVKLPGRAPKSVVRLRRGASRPDWNHGPLGRTCPHQMR